MVTSHIFSCSIVYFSGFFFSSYCLIATILNTQSDYEKGESCSIGFQPLIDDAHRNIWCITGKYLFIFTKCLMFSYKIFELHYILFKNEFKVILIPTYFSLIE